MSETDINDNTDNKKSDADEPTTNPTVHTARRPTRRRRLPWRLFAYPAIIIIALYWANQNNSVTVVGPAIFEQPLAVLAEQQAAKAIPFSEEHLAKLPPGHAVLLAWNGQAALSYASDTALDADQLKQWRLG